MTGALDLCGLLRVLGRPASDVHSAWRVGSRVYGTAGPRSDQDFVAVLAAKGARRDLVRKGEVNVVVHTVETFQAALDEQNVFALECWFAPPSARLLDGRPPFRWRLDRGALATAAAERSAADFAKAAKTFEAEPAAARKRLFHSLRVPMFALAIARDGRLEPTMAAPVWAAIRDAGDADGEALAARWGHERERLVGELAALAGAGRRR